MGDKLYGNNRFSSSKSSNSHYNEKPQSDAMLGHRMPYQSDHKNENSYKPSDSAAGCVYMKNQAPSSSTHYQHGKSPRLHGSSTNTNTNEKKT